MKIDRSGFEEFNHKLEQLQQIGQVPFDEFFSNSFISKYTDSHSFDELLQKSDFDIKTPEDFEAITEQDMNRFIANHTSFSTWEEMQVKALEERLIQQLGF